MRDLNTQWKMRRTSDGGYEGTIRVSVGGLPVYVGAEGDNPRQAIARAAIAMQKVIDSPIASAVLPPGSAAAIEAIRRLATSRNVRATLKRFGGKGARRLARAFGIR